MPELHRLDKGVYGVTRLFHPAGDFGVNAGFLISQNKIIHVDASMTISDGEWLLSQSLEKAITKPSKLLLILTHHHSDHIFGIRVFKEAGAKIIAHEKTKSFLAFRTPPLFRRILDTYKPFILKRMVKSMNYSKKEAEKILGDVKLFLPDETFKEDREMDFGNGILHLIYTPGHVPTEISVYHSTSKTLFAGDTVYEGMPLTTRFGGPKQWKQWIKSLEKLQQFEIKNIVPGHGKICGKEEIQRNIEYLENLLREH
jgi:glyoxylase-like metal-dependent hydrolase (beta-lactamase superfamily II)